MKILYVLAAIGVLAVSFGSTSQAAAPEGLNCPRGYIEKVDTKTGKLECKKLGFSAGVKPQQAVPPSTPCQRGYIKKKNPSTGKIECKELTIKSGSRPNGAAYLKLGDIKGE